jgi:hypothetical protein
MKFIVADSNQPEVIEKVKSVIGESKVDLLFIDGGHSYENVSLDYKYFKNFVKPNGIIAFHDATRNGNVRRFINEIADAYAMDGDFDFRVQFDGSKYCGHCGIVAFVKGDR